MIRILVVALAVATIPLVASCSSTSSASDYHTDKVRTSGNTVVMDTNGDGGMGVSPGLVWIDGVECDDHQEYVMMLTNRTDYNKTYSVSIVAGKGLGEYAPMPENLLHWIRASVYNVYLPAKTDRDIRITLDVPEDSLLVVGSWEADVIIAEDASGRVAEQIRSRVFISKN